MEKKHGKFLLFLRNDVFFLGCFCDFFLGGTPLKVNILNPKNEGLEDDFPFELGDL